MQAGETVRRRVQFPHIPRKITAGLFWYTEKAMLWGLLSAFLMINLYARANLMPNYWPSLTATLAHPYSAAFHQNLAEVFWKEGLLEKAKKELMYDKSVLGTSTSLLNEWENEPTKLAGNLAYWKDVVKSKPDYRDGYIAAASLAYQLGKTAEAKTYLNQALVLDPDNTEIQKLLGILGK